MNAGAYHVYLLRRVLGAFFTLLLVLAFNFMMFRVIGDPVKLLIKSNLRLSPQEQQQLREELGLGDPIPVQFVGYLGDTLRGSLGVSFSSGRPVTEVIAGRLWPTILLVGTGTITATVLGLLAGIRGAWTRGSAFDTTALLGSVVLYSAPEGWLGMILLITFAGNLGWFPVSGYASSSGGTGFTHVVDVLGHLFLPALTLTLGYVGQYVTIMRSSMLETIGEDYITVARAKGLSDRAVRRRHAVPNALLPTLTVIFLNIGFVLGGSVIVESVFSWPGVGRLTFESIERLDFPVLQGIFLLFSAAVILLNLLADLLYAYVDPRIREMM
ncbi:MAG: ABC transporter permease [Actinobacteria bacterium]|nr:ABC transporter permease [Actinomycetota bacterium]